jgi:prepilin-type processing-associated H-X9-DG protein
MLFVLPFLEEQALFDKFDLSTGKTIFNQPQDPQAAVVASLICPSDSGSGGRFFRHAQWTDSKPFAKGNYAAFASPIHITHLEYFPGAFGGFIPGSTTGQESRKIKDTTKTLAITEVRTRADEADQRGAWALPWSGASLVSSDIHHLGQDMPSNGLQKIRIYIPGKEEEDRRLAQTPNKQESIFDQVYSCEEIPALLERMPCEATTGGVTGYWSAAPRSMHSRGVNACFLDGHVGFLPDDVDFIAYSYMISTRDESVELNVTEHVK